MTRYSAGYAVHISQATRAFADATAWEAGRLSQGFEDQFTLTYPGGRERVYWCKYAQALMRHAVADRSGSRRVEVAEEWRMARVRLPGTEDFVISDPLQCFMKDGNCVGALDSEGRPFYALFSVSLEPLAS